MPLPIQNYALIGDCHTAALVGRDGSIDWLCLPRFDSGACFAALLGSPEHGRWLLATASEVRAVRRRYREGTLILETEFDTDEGTVRVIDCMPLSDERWDVVRGFSAALLPDEIVVGGGQAERLKKLPARTRRGDNADAFLGGFRLWGAAMPAPSSTAHADPRRDEKACNPGKS